MKKLTICILALTLSVGAFAQRKKTVAATPQQLMERAAEDIQEYRYDEALEGLEKARTALAKKKKSTAEVDDLIDKAEFGNRLLHATDKVTIVDSMVVDKANFLKAYKLSEETGRLSTFEEFFKKAGAGTVYQTELGNRIYFSRPTGPETTKIFSSDLLSGNLWSEPQELDGIGDEYSSEAYPFVTTDGSTLYFASKDAENGIGGYDIYVTRIGSAGSRYLRPENLGYPYNSPYNDYMYVVDEMNNLGWFASDRYQPEDKVCLYVFVPNASRTHFSVENDDPQLVRHVALLDEIKYAQSDKVALSAGRTALKQVLTNRKKEVVVKDFVLVIDDHRTYTQYAQFKNATAKTTCAIWMKKKKELDDLEQSLQQNRDGYAAGKKNLASTILQQEKQVDILLAEVKELEKKTRNLEIGK